MAVYLEVERTNLGDQVAKSNGDGSLLGSLSKGACNINQ